MGGEKAASSTTHGPALGSPPHGRGKEGEKPLKIFKQWITPAWAGKSFASTSCKIEVRDHPRMGGEKTKKIP